MKKNIFALLGIVMLLSSCSETPEKENKTVILKGSIVNYDQDTLYMNNVSSELMVFQEEIQAIELTGKTNFDYRFDLEKPTYFNIGRTFLYLSPGDSLVAKLDTRDRSFGSFTGKGAEANNYLTKTPYPKGGSFWGEREFSSKFKTYQDVPVGFQKVADARLAKLNNLTQVSEAFKELETARVKFDYVNSLENLFYLYYPKFREGKMTQEEMELKIEEANKYLTPYKKPFLDNFNDTKYLQLEVFQSLLYSLNKDEYRKDLDLPMLSEKLQEYFLTSNLVNELKYNGYSNQVGEKLNKEAQKIKDPTYSAVLKDLQKEYQSITKGNTASDLTFTKLDGSTIKLSDYKGKVIVLDLWATWCGPCMNEKPYFEALEKKYHANEDVEMISLSIDTEEKWKSYFKKHDLAGNQLQINRSQLSNYKVAAIPRFFVIDKNFKIVDVYAPLPSSGDLEVLINKTLEK
ncbi:TlpA disulfide reductase family protein [Ancylomarina sp. 16SWW S1-10-2]|uniref:TlpA family protein disulfide reductase n=1 Tax=Ancylomarina sp. 16SWW S1-10-2 TaxID=2499681 RepID=UPI00189DD7C1|nr:TlpA disulfide reductase family protein [Ancylomarina sp. 16SWW S1-10-2]